MPRKPDPSLIDADNPEWTDADFARARPAAEVLPAAVFEGLVKRAPGQRGKGKRPAKVPVTIRLDPALLARLKAQGLGWQTRISKMLEEAAPAEREKPRRRAKAG